MIKRTNAYPDLERDLQFYPLGINEPILLNRFQNVKVHGPLDNIEKIVYKTQH